MGAGAGIRGCRDAGRHVRVPGVPCVPPAWVGRAEPAQIWGSWKMRRTKPISSSVPAKQKRGGKRICGGKGAGTLSWGWLYRSWVSKELLGGWGGPRRSAWARPPAAEHLQLQGWGQSLCQGCPCCTHQLKTKGNDSKTGSWAGWGRNIPWSPGSKDFPTLSLAAGGDGGTPCPV